METIMQARDLGQTLLRSIPVFLLLVPAGARAQSATYHDGTLKGQYVLHSTGTMAGNNFAAVGKEVLRRTG